MCVCVVCVIGEALIGLEECVCTMKVGEICLLTVSKAFCYCPGVGVVDAALTHTRTHRHTHTHTHTHIHTHHPHAFAKVPADVDLQFEVEVFGCVPAAKVLLMNECVRVFVVICAHYY